MASPSHPPPPAMSPVATAAAPSPAGRPPAGGAPLLLQLAWSRYLGQLQRRPLRTKALTAAAIAATSDVIAQSLLAGRVTNPRRTLAVAAYGLLWNGPSAHYWQKFIEVLFQGKSDIQTVIRKVLFDQVTYGPLCNLMFMSFATLVLEGRGPADLGAKLKRDYWTVQLKGWRLWPVAALINYKFVPLKLRVLFINVVALIWSTFLLLSSRK